VQAIDRQHDATELLCRRNDAAGSVADVHDRRLEADGDVFVQDRRPAGPDRDRTPDGERQPGAVSRGDGVREGARGVEELDTDVDRPRVQVRADDVRVQIALLDRLEGCHDLRRLRVRKRR